MLLHCFLLLFLWVITVNTLTKVVVPSIYREYFPNHPFPSWFRNVQIQEKHNYTVSYYQKNFPEKPNYIAKNRGTEGAVYLRYIIDHYDDFPDIAIFVHAHPEAHSPNWLPMLDCISPNATYLSINYGEPGSWMVRDSEMWETHGGAALWMEQCWRDLLRITWKDDFSQNRTTLTFEEYVPPKKQLFISAHCCQQFILSREMVHKRPLSVWKHLFSMINEQDQCHLGSPNYTELYNHKLYHINKGPEPQVIDNHEFSNANLIQGGSMEHLAHVIFGHKPILSSFPFFPFLYILYLYVTSHDRSDYYFLYSFAFALILLFSL
jgi:hypothetical protein